VTLTIVQGVLYIHAVSKAELDSELVYQVRLRNEYNQITLNWWRQKQTPPETSCMISVRQTMGTVLTKSHLSEPLEKHIIYHTFRSIFRDFVISDWLQSDLEPTDSCICLFFLPGILNQFTLRIFRKFDFLNPYAFLNPNDLMPSQTSKFWSSSKKHFTFTENILSLLCTDESLNVV